MSKLIALSLGPGDPGLITRSAWLQLQRSDTVWTYPIRSLRKESYALDIVLRAGLPLPEQHQALLFPMTHDVEKLARHWLKAAQTVQQLLQSGRDVLFWLKAMLQPTPAFVTSLVLCASLMRQRILRLSLA